MRKSMIAGLTAVILAAHRMAGASNLISNSDFDADTSGWTAGSTYATSGLDTTAGIPEAPSLHVAGTSDESGVMLSSCISVDTTTDFDLSGFARAQAGSAIAGVIEFIDSACTSPVYELTTDAIAADGRWHDLEVDGFALDDGVLGVQFAVAALPDDSGTAGSAQFDHLRLARTGTLEDDGINLAQDGLSGTWYDPDAGGQGFELSFTTTHDAATASPIFGAWFTYDLPSNDTADQRWYSIQGATALGETSAGFTVYQNTGGNFDAPPSTVATAIGTGSIKFFSCSSGLFTYALDDGSSGIIPLHNLMTQYGCAATPSGAAVVPNDFGLSGVFYDPAEGGQGVLIQIDAENGAAFLGWYTYAVDGSTAAESQRWLSAQGTWTSGSDSTGLNIYVSTGGGFTTGESNNPVQVGSATLTFTSCSAATLAYDIASGEFAGLSGTLNLVRLGAEPESCPLSP